MTREHRTVALIGLPSTGKTTYLGALWQVIQDACDDSVVEVDVTGDRAYLQDIGERVASGDEMRRTDVNSVDGLTLTVRFQSGLVSELEVPDLSGETVRMLVEERVWHPNLYDAIAQADAIALFLHPDQVRVPVRRNLFAEMSTAPGASSSDGPPLENADTVEFTLELACTGAIVTDILENILTLASPQPQVRLAIVVSAWDLTEGGLTPDEWLSQRLPAIAAWCRTNKWRVSSAVFGVSAIGGSLPDDRDALLAKGSVSARAYAQASNGRPIALSAPLEWAITNDDE